MGAEQSTQAAVEGQVPQQADEQGISSGGEPKALIVVGPSGVGKGTLVSRLLSADPERYRLSVSTTTRAPRLGEQCTGSCKDRRNPSPPKHKTKNGVDYVFAPKEAVMAAIARGEFLEHAEVHGALYGTRRDAVEALRAEGRVAVLDIDVQGARQVRASEMPAIFVFVAPPSLEELERRLRAGRDAVAGGDEGGEPGGGGEQGGGEADLQRRLGAAKGEITSLNEKGLYDYLLINDDLDSTAEQLARIARRAALGLEAEPGHVPEKVILEDEGEVEEDVEEDEAAVAASVATTDGGTTTGSAPVGAPAAGGGVGAAQQASSAPSSARAHPSQQQQQQQHVAAVVAAAAPEPAIPAAAADLAAGLERWRGRVALVTGASSGIGWAVCEALGRAGMRVVAVARRRERLEELQRLMLGPGVGLQAVDFLPVVCDVTKEAEVQAAFNGRPRSNPLDGGAQWSQQQLHAARLLGALPRIVLKRWPDRGIDVLVNNAGLSRNNASLFDGNTSSWVEMVSTNLLGGCMTSREVVRDMRRRGEWGHIINMVGLSGHRIPDAGAGGSFFAATKFGVRAVTDGLRQEARAAGVPLRVSGISPGLVDTEFFKVRAFGDDAAAAAAIGRITPLEPADVARAVVWCLAAPPHMEVNDVVIRPREQVI
ncbi:guanylate kinase 1 [Monoraphidium neglectum]|uniref:Guanylate kinase 1 n=1 Tax=Monoraphidium neglectum TaxID=145388 RepID=A0A0D2N4V1_9CHLO|nr:guanylate kinase 1 [Monoraphidium neglectum]KIZ01051.1 guanylate kinase 1 [Monoraphidium neglectum]|eukprot:XP_013900070.1 guanylate kinase 1 [Monoraphidium neglectum]